MPSTIAILPSMPSGTGVHTSAGMFIVRARIAVWELVDPSLVTNASTLERSSWIVSLGARSSARMIACSISMDCAPLP